MLIFYKIPLFKRQDLPIVVRASLDLLYNPGWPGTQGDPPALPSQVLGLQVYATTPSSTKY